MTLLLNVKYAVSGVTIKTAKTDAWFLPNGSFANKHPLDFLKMILKIIPENISNKYVDDSKEIRRKTG